MLNTIDQTKHKILVELIQRFRHGEISHDEMWRRIEEDIKGTSPVIGCAYPQTPCYQYCLHER